ncbi:hypothetical protein INT47_002317 [Mucor saturninus]|uniref:Uncharacterized protein n=1 Tax=Mucor saturninus TaxID=64648 RepID=A0A8H7QKC8_9FUNG|nr:hypothetical protein INT47_002317 [Mucor saturninus]
MTLIIRQIRALIAETPLRKKQHDNKNSEQHNRRKSLSVKISKEPPAIVYFTRDKLEDSFECIFDPQVHHDSETDHPDLLFAKAKKTDCKPWQKAPYCTASNKSPTFLTRFKSSFKTTPMAEPVA